MDKFLKKIPHTKSFFELIDKLPILPFAYIDAEKKVKTLTTDKDIDYLKALSDNEEEKKKDNEEISEKKRLQKRERK